MPAPTIEPITIAVSEKSGSLPSDADAVGDVVAAVVDAISSSDPFLSSAIISGRDMFFFM
jgi:hypothetical protein